MATATCCARIASGMLCIASGRERSAFCCGVIRSSQQGTREPSAFPAATASRSWSRSRSKDGAVQAVQAAGAVRGCKLQSALGLGKFEYSTRLWGRLLYNPDSRPQIWRRYLQRQFGPSSAAIETALANVSRILPIVTTAHALHRLETTCIGRKFTQPTDDGCEALWAIFRCA